MTMRIRTSLFLFSFLMLTVGSYATAESIQVIPVVTSQYKVTSGASFAIINTVERYVTHMHIGTVANFEKNYAIDWHLVEHINSRIEKILTKRGLRLIEVEEDDNLSRKLKTSATCDFFSSKCHLVPEVVPDLLAFSEQSDIDILILVQTIRVNIPGSFVKMSGYGLLTNSTLGGVVEGGGTPSAYAYAHISATVIYIKDPTLIGWYAMNRHDGRIDPFNSPDDMENVPTEEINKAERPVKLMADSLVRVLEKELFGSDEISREIEISKKKKRIKCTPGVGCKYVVE